MFTVLLCTDGSGLSQAALADGLAVVAAPDRVVIATAVEPVDPMLVVGAGMAGGVMSPGEAQVADDGAHSAATEALARVAAALGHPSAERMIVSGSAGPAICKLAASLPASVIVLGSRGHGGLRRAVLGSVSDHVVRHAPCPVVITGPSVED